MKIKVFFSLLLGSALALSAQGYKDGIEYYKADQYQNAKTILERTLNASSTDQAEANYYLGAIALHDKDLATAAAKFNAGIAANANFPLNYVGLGEIALKNGNESEAEANFKHAQKLVKKNAGLMAAIARAYFNADPVKYAKQIDKNIAAATKINPRDAETAILRGDIERAKDEWGKAAACYEEAIYYDDDCAEAYVKYANVYSHVNREFSIKKLNELLGKRSDSALAQRELAEKYYENDQWAKAAQVYGEYIKNPNHFKEDENRYAVLLYYGQKYDDALNLANKVLSEDPSDFLMKRIAFLSMAGKAEAETDEAKAKELFVQAKALGEKFFANNAGKIHTVNDYTTMGNIFIQLDEYPAAVAEFEKAVELNPDRSELLKSLSNAYRLANRDEDAVKAMTSYVNAIGEENASANDLYALANRYFGLAQSSEGVAKIEAADNGLKYVNIVEQRLSNNYRIPFLKTRILLVKNNGDANEAVVEAAKSTIKMMEENDEIANDKNNYISLCTIVAGYTVANDKATARQYYDKIIKVDPNNEKILEYLKRL
ncbi:MAG: tetratricopeptide repeat protein [Muribaculaceae bacterium]|nr:tetratricopeptide repeat protein [Muribaculaceae bacterium]